MITNALAQTFYVSEVTGYFLTKILLYVNTKHDSVPLKIEIRETLNGVPTQKTLKGSTVVIESSKVNANSTTPVSTAIIFPSPVFLEGDTEYSLVVSCESDIYKMWVARMGTADVVTNSIISQNPAAGSIFYSQNGMTWEPRQTDDLMFEIYRAEFDTTKSGQFDASNTSLWWATTDPSPLRGNKDTSLMRVSALNSGLQADEYVMINGATVNQVVSIAIYDRGSGYLVPPTITIGAPSAGGTQATAEAFVIGGRISSILVTNPGALYLTAPTITITPAIGDTGAGGDAVAEISTTIAGFLPTDINLKSFRVVHSTYFDFVVDIGKNFPETIDFGGPSVTITRNVVYDSVLPKGYVFIPKGTQVSSTIQMTDSTFKELSIEEQVELNSIHKADTTQVVLSSINESAFLSNEKSIQVSSVLTTSSNFLSPVIDLDSYSAVMTLNRMWHVDHNELNYNSLDLLTVLAGATTSFSAVGLITSDHVDVDSLAIGKVLEITGCLQYVDSVSITNPGVYAVNPPTITFSAPGGGGVTATGTVVLSGGSSGYITGITITNSGSGYSSAPTPTINRDGGDGGSDNAVLVVNMSSNNGEYIINSVATDTPTNGNNTIKFISVGAEAPVGFNAITDPATKTYKLYNRGVYPNAPKGGSNQCNYITQVISLRNQSSGFVVYVDTNIPPEAEIFAYYRATTVSGADSIKNLPWIRVNPSFDLVKTRNKESFTETEFKLDTSENFDQIQVKLSMTSTTTAKPPTIKNFRMLALA